MTSSPDRAPGGIEPLPPPFASMWRLCKLGYRSEPTLMASAFVLALLSALPDALLALWLKLLGDGVLGHRPTLVRIAAIGLGVSATATWFLATVSTRVQRRFRDKVTIALESHVARLQATVPSVAHHERPEYLDRLAMLRDQVFVLDHMYMSLFSTCAWILRLVVTLALLMSIHPALVLLALFAIPTLMTSSWRPAVERLARERAAQDAQARASPVHAGDDGLSGERSASGRYRRAGDLRASCRVGTFVRAGRCLHAAGRRSGTRSAGRSSAAATSPGSSLSRRVLGASPGAVLLVLAAGGRLSAYIAATVGEIGFLRGFWMDGSRRLAWLEDYAAAQHERADLPAPAALRKGIRLDGVSFAYPGTSRLVLDDVSVTLPAGAVIALVGENGAGKSTLVKLLGKMYEPTSGQLLVDDIPLARIAAADWRSRVAGAFQDFFRFEFRARHTVGLGDVARLDDEPAVATAITRAGADEVIVRLKSGLETQLGPTWPDGAEVSFGQWQKLALARGFMRDEPLLLVLDEPTAALDAETEHALFERYAAAARGGHRDAGAARTRDHSSRLAPLFNRAHGRSHHRPRRRATGGVRIARGADGPPRTVRRAVFHSGGRVSHVGRLPFVTPLVTRAVHRSWALSIGHWALGIEH
jgi:ATP-binding cassette subfamily B protein